ncbi:pyrroline-5-carboxylate reductase [Achromobacter deleyi]|uniref:pyrroline-5-carboxylate reductase n=1 Tax=Achromobacter deleyi TaxID=1353891 RepID=UPI0014929240|nr:pyrroline-5-carboxylate reductase [Achromobacter deleyi]QVQ25944.1 pyrroline-5-carboxylate reductase [Achromobacter deleyi]UIP21484.1 pyrroline-5-carboxylate reductase [Achromobacter deleyi]
MREKIVFIGGGNMASAIIDGLLGQGRALTDFLVIEPYAPTREALIARGLPCRESVGADIADAALCVLATKPQVLREACGQVHRHLPAQATVVSIAAGVELASLSDWLGGHARIVRAMPNTPAKVGLGMTGLYATPACGPAERDQVDALFAAVGERIWTASEAMIDAVTAVTGSGPGYVFHFMAALEKGAVELGFAPADARRLAVSAFRGAAGLAASEDVPLTELQDRVTSKGGTTYAALSHMQEAGVAAAITQAVHKAEQRARELSAG